MIMSVAVSGASLAACIDESCQVQMGHVVVVLVCENLSATKSSQDDERTDEQNNKPSQRLGAHGEGIKRRSIVG